MVKCGILFIFWSSAVTKQFDFFNFSYLKIAIYGPPGSGTLRQQLTALNKGTQIYSILSTISSFTIF